MPRKLRMPQGEVPLAAKPRNYFATTHWSVVLAAGQGNATGARVALAALCQSYWYPLYTFIRRRGFSASDAQDLTQEFFARLLEHHWLAVASPERGRFRSFLLGALNHFLAKEWRRQHAGKRGGYWLSVPLDTAEVRYGNEPVTDSTPEQHFERKWALTLLESVLQRLEGEFNGEKKPALFAALKPCLVGDPEAQPYSALAEKLGTQEGALRVTVHRLRKRYRQLLREEVAQTVASPEEVEAEILHLFSVLASG